MTSPTQSDGAMARESWNLQKPTVSSERGTVTSQDWEAAAVGGDVLRQGGNAIDAAIATAFALTVREPWMSGLGGGGFMIVYSAAEQRAQVVDFGMVSPRGLKVEDFPLTNGMGGDMFGWPSVVEDRNIHGPRSIAVPGSVAGYAAALERFGTRSWSQTLEPAIELADRGHRIDWWTTLQVAASADTLQPYASSADVYLPGGLPPSMPGEATAAYLPMDSLARTLRRLSEQGPRDFYEGALAKDLIADIKTVGGYMTLEDLAAYEVRMVEPLRCRRGDLEYLLAPGLTAGPTFADALSRLPVAFAGGEPDAAVYEAYARSMIEAYQYRLESMGHAGDQGDKSCTTHIGAVDSEGNMVLITTTLLSRFGSRVVMPNTGILMNNGINWFDPRPGRANSIAPGQRPLSNMCPMMATRQGQAYFGFGASGGRKIMPAVFQLASFVGDFGMGLASALAQPRIDISLVDKVIVDPRLTRTAIEAIGRVAPTVPWPEAPFPSVYAIPSGVMFEDGLCYGAAHIHGPLTAAVGA